MARAWWAIVLVGCGGGKLVDTSAEGDPAETGPGTTDPAPAPLFDDVAWTLDATVGSLVHVTWEQGADADVAVLYSVDAGVWLSSPVRARGAGAHEEILLGVPFDHDVEFKLVAGDQESDAVVATTGPKPTEGLEPDVLLSTPGLQDPNTPYILGSITDVDERSWSWILDRQARLVWALPQDDGRVSMYTRVAADGAALLIDQSSQYAIYDNGVASHIQRVTLDGVVHTDTPTPGQHHAFTQLADGTLIYPAMVGYYQNETIEVIDPAGTQTTLWDCNDELTFLGWDYCGSNTIFYDPARDHLLFSLYSVDTVVEIDLATGKTEAIFGHQDEAWAFDPPESAFWFQHGAVFTADGTLMVSTKDEEDGDETLVREYELDDGTLREVWSFGQGEGVFASTGGEVHRLGNRNILHNYGSASRLREATEDGEVVWDLEWNDARRQWLARTEPLGDLYALLPSP